MNEKIILIQIQVYKRSPSKTRMIKKFTSHQFVHKCSYLGYRAESGAY